ncbi:hypothetical protein DFH08DRAFT_413453 [Mycena albidolilacea]|uniref:Uncharacterized protein n=1 Tax=Mycena albidolilacea TaxID=1033008 RepID=A0AAD7AIC6_9AGAR|nr:hypothetical protein DFH08DRAFT_413453 [Mycena albidolilacea]
MSFSDVESTIAPSGSSGCKSPTISNSSTLGTISSARSLIHKQTDSVQSGPEPGSNSRRAFWKSKSPGWQHIRNTTREFWKSKSPGWQHIRNTTREFWKSKRPDWQNVRRIALMALILINWTAVSAACLAFYIVVRKFMARGLTVDRDVMNQLQTALIVGCIYSAIVSLLLFGRLVSDCRRSPPKISSWWWFSYCLLVFGLIGWMATSGGLLSENPLVPFGCPGKTCLPSSVAEATWSKVTVVVWVVEPTLFVHSILWIFIV